MTVYDANKLETKSQAVRQARNIDSLRIRNGLAVFWSRPGWRQAFHADTNAKTPLEAAQAHRDLFPADVVRSVRDSRGRFAPFKA